MANMGEGLIGITGSGPVYQTLYYIVRSKDREAGLTDHYAQHLKSK